MNQRQMKGDKGKTLSKRGKPYIHEHSQPPGLRHEKREREREKQVGPKQSNKEVMLIALTDLQCKLKALDQKKHPVVHASKPEKTYTQPITQLKG